MILTKNVSTSQANYTDTTINNGAPIQSLNPLGTGYPGVLTHQGTGSNVFNLGILSGYNASFFATPGLVSSVFSSNARNNFADIAASQAFNNPADAPFTAPSIHPSFSARFDQWGHPAELPGPDLGCDRELRGPGTGLVRDGGDGPGDRADDDLAAAARSGQGPARLRSLRKNRTATTHSPKMMLATIYHARCCANQSRPMRRIGRLIRTLCARPDDVSNRQVPRPKRWGTCFLLRGSRPIEARRDSPRRTRVAFRMDSNRRGIGIRGDRGERHKVASDHERRPGPLRIRQSFQPRRARCFFISRRFGAEMGNDSPSAGDP